MPCLGCLLCSSQIPQIMMRTLSMASCFRGLISTNLNNRDGIRSKMECEDQRFYFWKGLGVFLERMRKEKMGNEIKNKSLSYP